jgi:hypothetical protein
VLGVGSGLAAWGLLLVFGGQPKATPDWSAEIRKAMRGMQLSMTVGRSVPLGARKVNESWYVSHKGSGYGAPPFRQVDLVLTGADGVGAKRLACEVIDPEWGVLTYRFWDENVADYHLPVLTDATCTYPGWFKPNYLDSDETPALEMDGQYEVQWWVISEDGQRVPVARDSFEMKDKGLVQDA